MHPEEKEAVRTTIVGGRPPGSGKATGEVPQGIEVLVKKAAVDAAFKARLLKTRAGAAQDIGLELSPSEAAMLSAVPAAQLEAIIARTRVSRKVVPALLGHSAAAMLVALSAVAVVTDGCTLGSQPDQPETTTESVEDGEESEAEKPVTAPDDKPTPPPAPQGIRPDAPPPKETVEPPTVEPPEVKPPEEPAPPEPEPPEVKPKPAPKPPPVVRGISPDRPPVSMGIRVDRPPARKGTDLDLPESESR